MRCRSEKMKALIVGLCTAALVLCAASAARADTIVITDGAMSTDFDVLLSWGGVSDRFELGFNGFVKFLFQDAPWTFGINGGDTVDFSTHVVGPFELGGAGTIDGARYEHLAANFDLLYAATP